MTRLEFTVDLCLEEHVMAIYLTAYDSSLHIFGKCLLMMFLCIEVEFQVFNFFISERESGNSMEWKYLVIILF